MKKLLLIAILAAVGYFVGTGDAAAEWKALRFWQEHRETLPMLEARANWALSEVESSKPTIDEPPGTVRELEALAKKLMASCSPEKMPGATPTITKEELEAHRDRSAALVSYRAARDAATSISFHRENDAHLSMLGAPLDSDHKIIVWTYLTDVTEPATAASPQGRTKVLGWRTALNLSTRERIASVPVITRKTK